MTCFALLKGHITSLQRRSCIEARIAVVSISAGSNERSAEFGSCVSLGDYCNVSNSNIGDYSYRADKCDLPLAAIGSSAPSFEKLRMRQDAFRGLS